MYLPREKKLNFWLPRLLWLPIDCQWLLRLQSAFLPCHSLRNFHWTNLLNKNKRLLEVSLYKSQMTLAQLMSSELVQLIICFKDDDLYKFRYKLFFTDIELSRCKILLKKQLLMKINICKRDYLWRNRVEMTENKNHLWSQFEIFNVMMIVRLLFSTCSELSSIYN